MAKVLHFLLKLRRVNILYLLRGVQLKKHIRLFKCNEYTNEKTLIPKLMMTIMIILVVVTSATTSSTTTLSARTA